MEGLKYSYLYGLAVDSGNPQVVLVSASIGPSRAYSTENAESFVYRKDNDDKKWRAVTKGLPEPSGTTITIFASNPVSSTPLTITVYLCQLIQVVRGRNSILHGQENTLHKLLGPLH